MIAGVRIFDTIAASLRAAFHLFPVFAFFDTIAAALRAVFH